MPFRKDLEEALRLPVMIANDANCFALAETKLGAVASLGHHPEVVFGVIMGTGVGGGLVVHDQVIAGAQGIAGEWGHNFLDESGGPCYCGKTGCVETVISGPALQKYYASLSGRHLSMKAILEYYAQGDAAARQTMERLIGFFGKALSVVINIVDPGAIILGGGLGNIDLLYTKGKEAVAKHVFNDRPDIVLLKPVLGDSAGVFGAALLTA
jgi:predicted NBD/HSP70 family sugar kinase